MLAVGRRPQSQAQSSRRHTAVDSSSSRNPCRLSFYDTPPSIDVDIDTFELYGVSRLQVLRRIDVLQARGTRGEKLDKEINKADLEHLFHKNINNGGNRIDNSCSNKKDQISHFVLRMAYCQTEELRRWFLTNECILFKIRFETSKSSDVDQFLRERKVLMKYPPISVEEKMRLKSKLMDVQQQQQSSKGIFTENNYNNTVYYKVPFLDVLSLVTKRQVYLEKGFAYVSRSRILSIVEGKFRTWLSKSLIQTYAMQHTWSNDSRIGPIVRKLSKVAFQYGGGGMSLSSIANGGALGNGDGTLNTHAVTQIFVDYLKSVMGHSDPKMKPAGVGKLFVSVGTRKPNTADKTCPIANRVHKSNTQKYTIFFDTLVMEQGCWDGCCQATNKHVYYQIRENGRCVKVGWNPPVLDPTMIANTISSGITGKNSSSNTPSNSVTTTPKDRKVKSFNAKSRVQVTP